MGSFDYVSNSANGHDAQDVLQNMLLALRRSGDLSIIVKTYRAGYPLAKNAGQFYAPFMIQFNNGARWIIFSTTSCRTDRIKGQQWDADNLKRIDTSIERAVLAYPDDAPPTEVRAFQKQKAKYDSGEEISRIDDIVKHSELVSQIQRRSLGIFNEEDEQLDNVPQEATLPAAACLEARQLELEYPQVVGRVEQITASLSESGRLYDFNGRAFEGDVASLLGNAAYLARMKQGDDSGADRKFVSFTKMLSAFGVDPKSIAHIDATAKKEDIGLLPNGGQPKTDVLASFTFNDGKEKEFTISCKRTTRSSVSVHQYSADAFADVLDAGNASLRKLLNMFQYYANARDMPGAAKVELEKQLCPLLPKLCRWVLGGFGGGATSPIQCADYLVVYNPKDEYFAVHSVEDYMVILLERATGAFGTPFGWTYPSKQRGRSIQLKLPIIR